MRNQRTIFLLGMALLALALLACDAGSLVAFSNPTPTRTRTPRPTFTPKPSVTATPADTETPAATDTPAAPTKAPTSTKAPVATARPVTKQPTAVPPPPAPSFAVTVDGYQCAQPNDPIWKITARVNRAQPPNIFIGGYVMGVWGADGSFLKASQPSAEDEYATMTLNGNCMVYNRYRSNVEIDVTEFRLKVPLTIRLIKSKTDTTPISPGFKADFAQPGNYYLQFNVTVP